MSGKDRMKGKKIVLGTGRVIPNYIKDPNFGRGKAEQRKKKVRC